MANFLTKAINQVLRPRSAFTDRPIAIAPEIMGANAVFPQANMQTYVRIYGESYSVYSVVSLMARKFGYVPRYLYQINQDDEGAMAAKRSYANKVKYRDPNLSARDLKKLLTKAYDDEIVEGTDLSRLLAQPNPYMGQDSYYSLIYTFKKLTGNVFVWLNRGDNDGVIGDKRYDLPIFNMWVLPSQLVVINVNRDILFGEIVGYTFYDSGQPIYLAKEDVMHWKDPNPLYDSYNFTQYYGMPPLQPGLRLITQDSAQNEAAVAMFQNGGARGVLANETFNNLNKSQIDQADQAINTKINNKQMKSAVVQLPGKWAYLYMGQSAVDMDLMEAMDMTFTRICNLLGCNPQLFGSKDTTFNNVEQARKDLITNAIAPDACSFKDEENRVLLRAFGYKPEQYSIDIDITDLPELADDMDKKTVRVMSNWTLTVDQKLEELGFEPTGTPEGQIRFIPNNLIPMEEAALPPLDPNMNIDGQTMDGTNNPNGNGQQVSNIPKGHTGNGHSKRLPLAEVDEIWSKTSIKNKNGKPL